jgi:hypothetical protein
VSTKLDIRTQGRELAEELEIPRTTLVSRQTAAAAIPSEPVPVPDPQPINEPARPRSTARRLSVNVMESLSEDREQMEPLNVRVASWVNVELNRRILEEKIKGKKIRKEKVVEKAIITYLGLEPPQ